MARTDEQREDPFDLVPVELRGPWPFFMWYEVEHEQDDSEKQHAVRGEGSSSQDP